MGYIPNELLLKSYKTLSMLTEDHKQGQTQITSAIRHLVAFDRYYKAKQEDCDLNQSKNRDVFVENVRAVVSISGSIYTANFYTTIKSLYDCGVGSNFFSVGVVNNSKQNAANTYDYPTRGQYPLFKVRNKVLIREVGYYYNARSYLKTEAIRSAFVVWLLRNNSLNKLSVAEIRNCLSSFQTTELVDAIMPKDEVLTNFIDGAELNQQPAELTTNGLLDLFNGIKKEMQDNKDKYRPYITAIKSKPFLLLAGISGTGKSRIVRELARACWDVDSEEYKAQKPRNFEMVQVKPNWHDSSELIGYVSRVSGEPVFVAGEFLKFVAKAWEEPNIPYFLCLDEMNLAPVEQYFAEYLSVIESRKATDGKVVTDPILKPAYKKDRDPKTGEIVPEDWYSELLASLLAECSEEKVFALAKLFEGEGITIPQNLIIVGTVNMDETTFSFSRKVLDRAMTIEMNEVDLYGGLENRYEHIGKLGAAELIGNAVEGVDVYASNKSVCDTAIDYLQKINEKLEGTPFKVAYRTRNEVLLYVVNNLPYSKNKEGEDLAQEYIIAHALDEITKMKILSRIEGDETKVSAQFLEDLEKTIKQGLESIFEGPFDKEESENAYKSVSLAKLDEMKKRLASGYTSFWS